MLPPIDLASASSVLSHDPASTAERLIGVATNGVPTTAEMSLMPVTPQWLPSEDSFERQLLERLVAEGRAFIKVLRYNQHRDQCLASAMLTDTGDAGPLLFVVPPWLEGPALAEDIRGANPGGNSPVWVWQPASQAMPRLPEAAITGQRIERPTVARPPTHLETDIETT